MKVARLVGVALIAVFALSAMIAATASATVPTFTLPITNRAFTAKSGTSVLRTPSEKDVVTCATSSAPGTIVNDNEVSTTITFSTCSLEEGANGPCTVKSVGASGSSIVTNTLAGLLAESKNPAGGHAAILFVPTGSHVFTTFSPTSSPCKTPTTAVEGSVAGLISPTGKKQTTGLISLAPVSAEGGQGVTEVQTATKTVKSKLTSFGAAVSTQEQSATVTYAEAVEVT